MIRKAFILGAVLGLRLRPLTADKPKPMVQVFGRPIIEYIFGYLKKWGVQDIIINTHHYPQVYYEKIGRGESYQLNIQYAHEKDLLDTGGGLKNVESFFDAGTFLMYNGDVITDGDLGSAVRFHCERKNMVTLILQPNGINPNVSMNSQNRITDFRGMLNKKDDPRYTFCGIHILEPDIFKYIPSGKAVSIIDVYLELLRQGGEIGGFLWENCYWRDLGHLDSYKQIHSEMMNKEYQCPFPIVRLGQDGSDRVYYRTTDENRSTIAMKYGKEKEENSYFVRILNFLKELGLPVPDLLYADPGSGIVLLEDLGDESLCHAFLQRPRKIAMMFYQKVIKNIAKLHEEGAALYAKNPFVICKDFTYKTYRWESQYFEDNLLGEFLQFPFSLDLKSQFHRDCDFLAKTLAQEKKVLIHRDLQSKNVMIKDDQPYFIDFQGMRFGLPQYDLASLLYDPYVSLEDYEKQELYEFYLDTIQMKKSQEREKFRKQFELTILQRLMQALGAYGFLGLKKGKKHFLEYIDPALNRLYTVLIQMKGLDGLKKVVEKALVLFNAREK